MVDLYYLFKRLFTWKGILTVNVQKKKIVFATNVFGKELKLEFEDEDIEEEYEEPEPTVQITLRVPESLDLSLRELGVKLDPPTNRQGAINYILFMYYQKQFSDADKLR